MNRLDTRLEVLLHSMDAVREEIVDIVNHCGGYRDLYDMEPAKYCSMIIIDEDPMIGWGKDEYFQAFAHALKVNEDGELLVYCERVPYVHDPKPSQFTKEQMLADEEHWYLLDWDSGMSYQHNIERLAYILTDKS